MALGVSLKADCRLDSSWFLDRRAISPDSTTHSSGRHIAPIFGRGGSSSVAAGIAAAISALRKVTPGPGPDRFLAPEIEEAVRLVQSGILVAEVEESIGKLL